MEPVPRRNTTILEVAQELEARGVDTDELRQLQDELDALDRPPGLIGRLTTRARDVAGRQWKHLMGELEESREAMALIVRRLQGTDLTPEEADKIRAQLVDLVKIFPAGLIAAANSAFPIPGTGLFTPWILARLGLMPSRWREAHLLEQLLRHQDRLRAAGHGALADRLARLRTEIEAEAQRRDEVGRTARLLTHWDANANGKWDPDEERAYLAEVDRLRALAHRFRARRAWFLEHDGEVFGPVRLSDVEGEPGADELLVCHESGTGWACLPDVFGRTPRFS